MNKEYLNQFDSIDFDKIIDHPNILIAARFWDEERYQAARICYKHMRAIDDMIDNYKSVHSTIAEADKAYFLNNVREWAALPNASGSNQQGWPELKNTIDNFHIPLWPLEAFAKSMTYDIDHNGFKTLFDFLEYSQGASVAPASIFVHLNGLTRKDGRYQPPAFDVKNAATPCAIFSYLVHIIRDFQKDQRNNLNYFADDIMAKNGISCIHLKRIAEGTKIPDGFRNMITEYCELAEYYKQQTHDVIRHIFPLLEPRYRLSLQIIFNLYLMVYERIDAKRGTFTTQELNPTPDEIKNRVYETIIGFED